MRPLGGLLLGHFGDRIGRKPLLVLAPVIMGVATFLIGLLPNVSADRSLGTGSACHVAAGARHRARRRVGRSSPDGVRIRTAAGARVLRMFSANRARRRSLL